MLLLNLHPIPFRIYLDLREQFRFTSKEPLGNLPGRSGSSEMVLFLREAMRAIASLGCEGVMRALASSMSPHVTPQQGPTPIFSAATADGITTVQTVSAAATTLPTTPFRDAARVKGYYTDRAIFTLLRCTNGELFFSYCYSVVAHFKRAATRQPRRKPTVETCVDNTAKLRRYTSSGLLLLCGALRMAIYIN